MSISEILFCVLSGANAYLCSVLYPRSMKDRPRFSAPYTYDPNDVRSHVLP
uniref:Uncharacterized protein n=1 Tax=Anguilla anguilla TaxID=7936 RepID=A0A0E9V721_ANGAN